MSSSAFKLPRDPYIVLGVSKDASSQEIRSARQRLLLRCNPDKVQDVVLKAIKLDEFHAVQEAYNLLSDKNQRMQYHAEVKRLEILKEADRTALVTHGSSFEDIVGTLRAQRPSTPPDTPPNIARKDKEPRKSPALRSTAYGKSSYVLQNSPSPKGYEPAYVEVEDSKSDASVYDQNPSTSSKQRTDVFGSIDQVRRARGESQQNNSYSQSPGAPTHSLSAIEKEIKARNEQAKRVLRPPISEDPKVLLAKLELEEQPGAKQAPVKTMPSSVPPSQLGLKILNSKTANVCVDIVAVHGLGAIPETTWKESKSGVDWLSDSDMLPLAVPEARIMRFGYDSLWLGKEPIRTKLSIIADKLLLVLSREREVKKLQIDIFIINLNRNAQKGR